MNTNNKTNESEKNMQKIVNKNDPQDIYIQQGCEYDLMVHKIKNVREKVTSFLLLGPPGVAKSTLARIVSNNLNVELETIDGSPSATRMNFEGRRILKDGSSPYQYGALPKAIKHSNKDGLSVLLINEVDKFQKDVQKSFNSLLAEGEVNLVTKENEKHEIKSGNKLVVIATMNPGLSNGGLEKSFKDRFNTHFLLDYPSERVERFIIKEQTGCNLEIADILANAGKKLREAADNMSLDFHLTPRQLCAFARHITSNGKFIEYQIKTMIINRLGETKETRQTAFDILEGIDFNYDLQKILESQEKSKEGSELYESHEFQESDSESETDESDDLVHETDELIEKDDTDEGDFEKEYEVDTESEDLDLIDVEKKLERDKDKISTETEINISETTMSNIKKILKEYMEESGINSVLDPKGQIRWTPLLHVWNVKKSVFCNFFKKLGKNEYLVDEYYGSSPYYNSRISKNFVEKSWRHRRDKFQEWFIKTGLMDYIIELDTQSKIY